MYSWRCFARFGLFGREEVKIGVCVLCEQVAGRALAAGFVQAAWVFAQQGLRQMASESGFAGVLPADEQAGVWQPLPMRHKLLPNGLVPRVNHSAGCFLCAKKQPAP